MIRSSTGEVADFSQADQFQAGKSQFECGYFACAMARSMAEVGKPPTLTTQQVIDDAESWYAQYDGTDAISNVNGMTLQQEYDLLQQIGLHYQAIDLDMTIIKGWLNDEHPVLAAVTETSILDLALGRNPYPWTPAGTHVILLTGIDGNNLLVRDSANCTDLYNPNSLRPGPRHYDATQMQLVSATVVVPPWLPRPTSALPPKETSMLPANFHDDGTKLTYTPNGHYFVKGFRDAVLQAINAGEDPNNFIPLENEVPMASQVELHANSGPGTRQICNNCMWIWTVAKGVKRSAAGPEIAWCYNNIGYLQGQIKARDAQIAALKNVPATGAHPEVLAALHSIGISATTLKGEVTTMLQEMNSAADAIAGAVIVAQQHIGN